MKAGVPVQQQAGSPEAVKAVPGWITFLLAVSCGLIVANLYYTQTLVGPIGQAIHLSAGATGLIVTLTQIGYVAGLLFIVPLSDIIENRRLTVMSLILVVAALVLSVLAPNAPLFLAASLLIGLGSVAAQVLVPYASYLATEEDRGRVVGNVMSGLLLGIMFARPVASFMAGLWGWKSIFIVSAIVTALLTLLLSRVLPARKPAPGRLRTITPLSGPIAHAHAGTAAPRSIPGQPVRRVQSVLDDRSLAPVQ